MKRIFFQISLLLTMVMSLQAQNTILDSSVHRATSGSSLQSMIFNNHPPKHEVRAVWLTTIGGIDWPHSYAQSAYLQKAEARIDSDSESLAESAH